MSLSENAKDDLPAVQDHTLAAANGCAIAQFVSFRIGQEEYCVDIMSVREIRGWAPVTPLPNQPDFVRGVLNLRGIIAPIFDLRCRFGLGHTEPTKLHVVIIFAVQERLIGILVDAVSDILSVSLNDILQVPGTDQRPDQKFLSGLITVDSRMVALLSLDTILDPEIVPQELLLAAEPGRTDDNSDRRPA